ncbi:hypothetical protein CONLIGDRAFT_682707 [Coniochaeta ligniaria NRRL 30616]|uniref:Uncharacterized protein n=1 Tax=Coniochaeta ligniaria NRRL 30616 TaxID=1408157 RepID=A0A1J7JJ66_9PEZI|nr:hypothetical protein CONLIGDRAFT_682707 [Coniochaeta ligniaria NRRL 30616]
MWSELLLTRLASELTGRVSSAFATVICLSRFGGKILEVLLARDPSLQLLTAKVASEEIHPADAQILRLQDTRQSRSRVALDILTTLKARLDVVSFMPLEDMTALQLTVDKYHRREPGNDGRFPVSIDAKLEGFTVTARFGILPEELENRVLRSPEDSNQRLALVPGSVKQGESSGAKRRESEGADEEQPEENSDTDSSFSW